MSGSRFKGSRLAAFPHLIFDVGHSTFDGIPGTSPRGVGTPWDLRKSPDDIIGIVCYTAGCNFRCPQCQNWYFAFSGIGAPLTPKATAVEMLAVRRNFPEVNRMAFSGGEPTLNRPWLLEVIRELKSLCPDRDAHFHIDTNGSLLTEDYIDELVDAGMTDIGIDLKAFNTDTFMKITGLEDSNLAGKYKEIAWAAVELPGGGFIGP